MIETYYVTDMTLPQHFMHTCEQYSVVTLLQAFELTQRLLEHPHQLPEGFSIEMLNTIQTQLRCHLPLDTLEHLQHPVPDFPLNGLILEQQEEVDLSGRRRLVEFFGEGSGAEADFAVDITDDNPEE